MELTDFPEATQKREALRQMGYNFGYSLDLDLTLASQTAQNAALGRVGDDAILVAGVWHDRRAHALNVPHCLVRNFFTGRVYAGYASAGG